MSCLQERCGLRVLVWVLVGLWVLGSAAVVHAEEDSGYLMEREDSAILGGFAEVDDDDLTPEVEPVPDRGEREGGSQEHPDQDPDADDDAQDPEDTRDSPRGSGRDSASDGEDDASGNGSSPRGGLPGSGSDWCGLDVLGLIERCTERSEGDAMYGPGFDSGAERAPDDSLQPKGKIRGSSALGHHESPALLVGAGVGLFVLLGVFLYRLVSGLFLGRAFVPLSWRLDRERVVNHPVRRAILDHLEKNPGATAQEVADEVEVRNARAVYHLAILKREECIGERRLEGRRHYFLRSAPVVDPVRLKKRAMVRPQRPAGKVLLFLEKSPGATVSHVARALGFSPGHAHYHLSRLEQKGLLVRTPNGRRVRHYLTGEGREMIALNPQLAQVAEPGGEGPTKVPA